MDIDYSMAQFSHPYGWRRTSGSLPDLKARYGLFKDVEAKFATRIGYFSDYPGNVTEERIFRGTYINFLTLGLKATIHRYNNQKGHLAVIAESNVPLLRFLHSGPSYRFIPALIVINENQLNNWLGYTLNAGVTYYVWEKEINSLHLAAAAHFYHQQQLTSFIGLSNFQDPSYSSAPTFSINTGFLYAPAHNLQLRIAFNLKLNGHNPGVADLGGILGMAWQPIFFRNK